MIKIITDTGKINNQRLGLACTPSWAAQISDGLQSMADSKRRKRQRFGGVFFAGSASTGNGAEERT